jgi:hypothetical protein
VETIAVALFLLLAVVVSGAFTRMSPVPLPLPLVQIALGSIIASVANLGVALKPDIFFLLFLPPLLFLDGWRIPKQGLFRDKGTILELALGLVLFTVACHMGPVPESHKNRECENNESNNCDQGSTTYHAFAIVFPHAVLLRYAVLPRFERLPAFGICNRHASEPCRMVGTAIKPSWQASQIRCRKT